MTSERELMDDVERLKALVEETRFNITELKGLLELNQKTIATLTAELAKCHERLEMDHQYTYINGELVRREIPMAERSFVGDGIQCRDATIESMGEQIEVLTASNDAHAAQNERLSERAERLESAVENFTIAYGMGWDLQGVVDVARRELEEGK